MNFWRYTKKVIGRGVGKVGARRKIFIKFSGKEENYKKILINYILNFA